MEEKNSSNRLQGLRSISRHGEIKIGQQAVGGRHNGHWRVVWQVEADGYIASSAPALYRPPFLNTSQPERLPPHGVSAAKYKVWRVPTSPLCTQFFHHLPRRTSSQHVDSQSCPRSQGRRILGKQLSLAIPSQRADLFTRHSEPARLFLGGGSMAA